jgi:hypothetical protein
MEFLPAEGRTRGRPGAADEGDGSEGGGGAGTPVVAQTARDKVQISSKKKKKLGGDCVHIR